MPILRAGPFATTSDSFQNSPTTPTENIYPVNCADDVNNANWPWRYYRRDNFGEAITIGLVEGSGSTGAGFLSFPPEGTEGTQIWFSYQAAAAWDFIFSYSAATTGNGQSEEVSIRIFNPITDIDFFANSDFGYGVSASISGTLETISLPRAVVPAFVQISFTAETNDGADWYFAFFDSL